jgi:hypothetical protein
MTKEWAAESGGSKAEKACKQRILDAKYNTTTFGVYMKK